MLLKLDTRDGVPLPRNHKSNALSENPITISEQRTTLMTVTSLAVIVERELASTIKEWLKQAKLVPDLNITC